MTYQELLEHNRNRCIHQIGIITDNIHRDVKAWVEIAKIGPWKIKEYSDETISELYVREKRQEKFKFIVATTIVGSLEIELIQPVYGMPIYEDYLARNGRGINHIKEKISDDQINYEAEAFKKFGIEILQNGQIVKDTHYYLDTAPLLGCMIELGNCPTSNPLPGNIVSYYPEMVTINN